MNTEMMREPSSVSVADIEDKKESNCGALYAALAKAQGQMGAADKSSEVTVSYKKDPSRKYKFHYADLHAVIMAAKKPLMENGLCVIQQLWTKKNELYVRTVLGHESGQRVESCYRLNPQSTDPQGYGSIITYMRRYAYAAMVGLAQADDDGTGACGESAPAAPADATKTVPRSKAPEINPADYLVKIKRADTLDELDVVGAEIKASKPTGAKKKAYAGAYKLRKAELKKQERYAGLDDVQFLHEAIEQVQQNDNPTELAGLYLLLKRECDSRKDGDALAMINDAVTAREIEMDNNEGDKK